MELLLTVEVPEAGVRTVVIAELDPFLPARALQDALVEWAGRRNVRIPGDPVMLVEGPGGERRGLDGTMSVFDSGLVSGSIVKLVGSAARHRFEGPAAAGPSVSLDITSGPDAGRTVDLGPGRYSLGRAPDAGVHVDDPAVSWNHLTIDVAADLTVTIEPNPQASYGTFVSASEVRGPRLLEREETVLAGNTQLVLRNPLVQTVGRRDRLGQVTFNPIPYRRPVINERRFSELQRPPDKPGERRFPLIMLAVPAVAAVLIVWLTHVLTFLVLALLSPLMMVSNHVSEGRSSRKNYRRDRAAFEKRVTSRAAEVSAALEEERGERLIVSPDVGLLGRQAAGRMGRLWERPRGSPDFLDLRLGLGQAASKVKAPVESGGDSDLQDWAAAELEHQSGLSVVPATLSLDEVGVAGVYGEEDRARQLATAMVLQSVLLHSPEQLVIAAGIPSDLVPTWSWLKWLPHTRSATSPLAGGHLVDERQVDDLVGRLGQVVMDRAQHDRAESANWPRVLLVLHERAEANRAALSALLDAAPHAGILCLWIGDSAAQLPRQCAATVRVESPEVAESLLRYTDPLRPDQTFSAEGVSAEVAERIARSLAPVRDVSAPTMTTGIPKVVGLFDLPGVDASGLGARWSATRPYELKAAIGVGVEGPFGIDLVSEGPHALIAGTSGAGKSELLQTLVCALASSYPPSRLNFLFIDYKGGASSSPFADLPHTVGLVSNLDERLALRALTSLRAELQRRMSLLEGRAKDLAEMLEVAPDEAPPSLVLVVDEFATLVKEIPEFVAGMVDVAQRGRSLGIHLVLATQRPTGAVNDNILANTNLRIALRVLDGADSTAVIGAKDAAAIPVPLRGRAYARTGPGALIPFQVAWAGAPFLSGDHDAAVLLRRFPFGSSSGTAPEPVPSAPEDRAPTQLETFVAGAAAAYAGLGLPPPRRPWVSPLPDTVLLAGGAVADPGRRVTLGLGDFPEQQRQSMVSVDLEADGGLLVFGSGGSGKTTFLRTVAADLAQQGTPEQVRMYVLDFGGRSLVQLEELPHVAAVATGDDLEKVTRMLTVLRVELEKRRRLLADARADSVSALRAQSATESLPRLVLLVDSYSGFHSTFESGVLYTWIETLIHLITEGRRVGIHLVMTNNRVLGIPTAITSAIAARLVMRMATSDEMISLGVPRQAAVGAELGPGRGFVLPATEVQLAVVSADLSGQAQAAALSALARRVSGQDRAPGLLALPEVAKLPAGGAAGPLRFAFGLADLTLEVVEVDVSNQNLVVVGPPLSGRSTALQTAVAGLRAGTPGVRFAGVGSLTSPLADSGVWDIAGFGRAHHMAALQEASQMVAGDEGSQVRLIVVIDSVEDFEALEYNMVLEPLIRSDAVRVLAACDTSTLERAYTGWLTELKRNRVALVLQPGSVAEVEEQTRVRPYLRPGQVFPPGRGVLVDRGQATLMQVGYRG